MFIDLIYIAITTGGMYLLTEKGIIVNPAYIYICGLAIGIIYQKLLDRE